MAQGFGAWGNDLYTGRRSYQIVAHRRWWYLLGLATAVVALVLLLVKPGLNPGIEFSGGTQLTLSDVASPSQDRAVSTVRGVVPDASPKVVNVGEHGLRIQMSELDDADVPELVTRLADAFNVSEDQISHTFIGPTWGKDVSNKTLTGIGWFLLFVTGVMTVYFRNWRMAVGALVALFHNLIVTGGVYAAVGWEVTPATVVGFLTIMGYSIYDTVVVFDKVRENTADTLVQSRYTYAEKANLAVNQTMVRSINTSVVALLPVGAILAVGAFILHAGTLRDIALALFVGIAVGTVSSIFLATPITVTLRELRPDVKAHNRKVLAARATAAGAAPGTTDDAPPPVRVGQLHPGAHQGQAAQPRRKKR
ncbi:MAG: protein translocase subunit SecF [Micrococcales bacterium]|nr:protein translocase subunit SecF [Micrococcales bacterium]